MIKIFHHCRDFFIYALSSRFITGSKRGCENFPFTPTFYRPPIKFREGNVFNGVCLFTWGIPCDACSNLFNLDLTEQGPPDIFKLVEIRPHCAGNPGPALPSYPTPHPRISDTQDALDLTVQGPLVRADTWWIVKHIWLANGRYTSYWNAFLLQYSSTY